MTAKTTKTSDAPVAVEPAPAALSNVTVLREPEPSPLADRFPLHVLPGAKTQQPNGLILESY